MNQPQTQPQTAWEMRPNSYSPISIQNPINLSLLSKNDIIDQKWPKWPKIIKNDQNGDSWPRQDSDGNELEGWKYAAQDDPFYSDNIKKTWEKSGIW